MAGAAVGLRVADGGDEKETAGVHSYQQGAGVGRSSPRSLSVSKKTLNRESGTGTGDRLVTWWFAGLYQEWQDPRAQTVGSRTDWWVSCMFHCHEI